MSARRPCPSAWASALLPADPQLARRIVRLAASPSVTAELVRDAVAQRLDSAASADVEAIAETLEQELGRKGRLADEGLADQAGRRLAAAGAVLYLAGRPGYPRRLADAWPELGAPLWIFVRAGGGHALPDRPTVAVVGARQATLDGRRTAARLAGLLVRHGALVVSGMARGIDQAAHLGALDAGGPTVAVLGTGFDVDYPYGDGPLRERIAAAGGLVTELPPGVAPRPRNFPRRNRILSGLADVTVVVEAREHSGALQTARLAAAQGREVLAVPGALSQPTARGALDLIRDGAQPLCRLEDVLEVLRLDPLPPVAPAVTPRPRLGATASAVLELLGPTPCSPGEIAAALGAPIAQVLAAAAELTGLGLAAAGPRGLTGASESTHQILDNRRPPCYK